MFIAIGLTLLVAVFLIGLLIRFKNDNTKIPKITKEYQKWDDDESSDF